MHLGNTNMKYNYFLNEQQLGKTSTEKDLGVIVDDNLNFEQHINEKISKARQMWGMIHRIFKNIDHEIFTLLFKMWSDK